MSLEQQEIKFNIMYEALKELDPVRINFNEGGLHILNIILGFIMFNLLLMKELKKNLENNRHKLFL